MDAVEFLKERKRMCTSFDESCYGCKLDGRTCLNTSDVSVETYKKNVEAVEKWSKEHPVKTRQSEFLKMFPNAFTGDDGVLSILPCNVDRTVKGVCSNKTCRDCRRDYWLQEVE